MESERMIIGSPIGQAWRLGKGLRKSIVEGEWLPSVEYLQNNVSPARNKTNDDKPSL
jgi:hypothetical protein